MAQETIKKSSPVAVAIVWLVVLVPLGWGLTFTVQNAMKIFTSAPPPAPTAPK